jgi:hypothetical protein
VIDLQYLEPRGYVPGGGLTSSTGTFYLNIPKNASTYLTNILRANGWENCILNDRGPAIAGAIVVLRDPVERWISGFATYASSWLLGYGYGSDHWVQDYNRLAERIIFDNLEFDDHTTPQVDYIAQLPSNLPIKYFVLNQATIVNDIAQYTGLDIQVTEVDGNVSGNNYDQRQITQFMRDRITKNPELTDKIIGHYKRDFDLIDSVK